MSLAERTETTLTVQEAANEMKVATATLYRWKSLGIALPSGYAWDAVPGRRLRVRRVAVAGPDAILDATAGRR